MAGVIINGVFSSPGVVWQSAVVGGTYKGYVIFTNPQNITVNLTALALSGSDAPHYAVAAGQVPSAAINPGQSIVLEIDYTPSGAGLQANVFLTATFVGQSINNPTTFVSLILNGTAGVANRAQPFPQIQFPPTKVGQTTSFANVVIVNTAQVNLTVTSLSMVTGTDFFISGAPVTPFTINVGQQSAAFTIQFTPTATGTRFDTMNVVDGGNTAALFVTGQGATLQSAFSLSGGTQGTLFAFPGVSAPLVLIANPTNFNTEEASSLVKLHDFGMVNQEKEWTRIRGHYEDLGQANVTFQLRARRIGQPDEIISTTVPIGTVAADGWIREFTSEPVPVTGELIQITISRLALGGPVSIIDYVPVFEPKGEVIGGT